MRFSSSLSLSDSTAQRDCTLGSTFLAASSLPLSEPLEESESESVASPPQNRPLFACTAVAMAVFSSAGRV